MQLDDTGCWARLGAAGHGALGTVHARRGVDAVPVVYVVDDGWVIIPIDAVKPKRGPRLQRLRNLDDDARAVLLVDHYDDDWSQLWWVRVHGSATEAPPSGPQLERLTAAFPAYAAAGSVPSVVVLAPDEVTGWAARTAD